MEEQKYYAGSIYVVNPSKIIDINGKIVKNKINGKDKIIQTVTFENTGIPVIAHKSLLHGFYNVFKENGKNHSQPRNKIQYYDAFELNNSGITKEDKEKQFYNIFEGDKILLSDYLFGYNHKQNLINRIEFFKYPFSSNNLELKKEFSQKLLKAKQFYTIEELKKILIEIANHTLEQACKTKTYKVEKQSLTQPTNSLFIKQTPSYAGIDDNYTIKIKKF